MELVQLACSLKPLLQPEAHLPKLPLDQQKVVQHLDHWVFTPLNNGQTAFTLCCAPWQVLGNSCYLDKSTLV